MRVVVTGGGSGGHIYPALAVIAALRERAGHALDRSDILYIGSEHGMERAVVTRANLPFGGVHSGKVRGRGPLDLARTAVNVNRGVLEAGWRLRRFSAGAVLATGGYVSVPVVLAAWLQRIPVVIYLPDIEPGLAVRFLARFASRIAVTAEAARAFLPPEKVTVTGYPVRPELHTLARGEARGRFAALDPNDRVLLAVGGSQGAHSINRAVQASLTELLTLTQIIHICGPDDEEALRAARDALPESLRRRYLLYRFLHEDMPHALAAADLAVSRSGASVLGEYPAVGLPSILTPYPHAGAHQRHNARVLVEAGAAVELDDQAVERDLLPAVRRLLEEPGELAAMRAAAQRLDHPHAAGEIASLLLTLMRSKDTRTPVAARGRG